MSTLFDWFDRVCFNIKWFYSSKTPVCHQFSTISTLSPFWRKKTPTFTVGGFFYGRYKIISLHSSLPFPFCSWPMPLCNFPCYLVCPCALVQLSPAWKETEKTATQAIKLNTCARFFLFSWLQDSQLFVIWCSSSSSVSSG